MKKRVLILIFIALFATSCGMNNHGNKSNIIASLFNDAQSTSQKCEQSSESTASPISSLEIEQSSSLKSNGADSSMVPTYDKIDVDLTTMSSTMVYSQVLNMLDYPSEYVGKIIKMAGPFRPFDSTNPNYCYPAIVVQDATACCASGIEFLLYGVPLCSKEGGNGYPLYNEEATIVGRFETYIEGTYMYTHLVDAIWLK